MKKQKSFQEIISLIGANNNEKAEKKLLRILSKDARCAEAWDLLGAVQLKKGRVEEAIASISQSLSLFPRSVMAFSNLSACYIAKAEYQTAIKYAREALNIDPSFGNAWSNLVNAQRFLGLFAEMEESLKAGLKFHPTQEDLLNNLGVVLILRKDYEAAVPYFKQAAKGGSVDIHSNLSIALASLGRYAEALETTEKMLAVYPAHQGSLMNKAAILYNMGRIEEAAAVYQKIVDLYPEYMTAQFSLGLVRLLLGDMGRGFELVEARYKAQEWCAENKMPDTPRWQGEPIEGKTLLICSEQGMGDSIHFLRYIPLLLPYKCKIVVALPSLLHCLFADLGVPLISLERRDYPHDVHVPMLSLPFIFKTDLLNMPPPLALPGARWLPIKNRIGIAWKGNPLHRRDQQRSLPLFLLSALLKTPGLHFVCLQKDVTAEEAQFLRAHGVEQVPLDTFKDTLHALEKCERVISADTALIHLSGSMGIPTWVLIPYSPDWRWLLHRTDSPWYPSIKLFRQSALDSWIEPLEQVRQELLACYEN